jgi:hypothetical protein
MFLVINSHVSAKALIYDSCRHLPNSHGNHLMIHAGFETGIADPDNSMTDLIA